jgi:CRISPR-associated protein Cmr4
MATMSMETTMLYLYVETPLHAGVGSGLSNIDLPIQRERPTQYPMIQGSGIKGKLRATAEDVIKDEAIINALFGSPTTGGVIMRVHWL